MSEPRDFDVSSEETWVCSRCARECPSGATWEQRLGWFDQAGEIVCAHCMTAEEWQEAFAAAAVHAHDEPADARALLVGARLLIDSPDKRLAAKLVEGMIETTRADRPADPLLAVAALLTIERGNVAVVRLFEEALRRLAADE